MPELIDEFAQAWTRPSSHQRFAPQAQDGVEPSFRPERCKPGVDATGVLSAVRTREFMAPAGRFSIIRGVERAERGQGEAASRPTMDRFIAATPSNGAEPTALRLRRRGQCDLWDDRVSGL